MSLFSRGYANKTEMISESAALPGRAGALLPADARNALTGSRIRPPYPTGADALIVAGGCFWGIEEIFWKQPGVISTAVGYAGGFTPNPSYDEVCTARTGHTEATLVVFDPSRVTAEELLGVFWEAHDPTLEMRQGADVGTQYRSGIYALSDAQLSLAEQTRDHYQTSLAAAGIPEPITTEIARLASAVEPAVAGGPSVLTEQSLAAFFFAEEYHQQYLLKNPNGYRCHSASGVAY